MVLQWHGKLRFVTRLSSFLKVVVGGVMQDLPFTAWKLYPLCRLHLRRLVEGEGEGEGEGILGASGDLEEKKTIKLQLQDTSYRICIPALITPLSQHVFF